MVTIVGTGGFGAWVGLFAAMAGVRELVLIDPGTVEPTDLARNPFGAGTLKKPKVKALRKLIARLRPEAKCEVHVKAFDPTNDAGLLRGIVFDGVSNKEVSTGLWELCSEKEIKYFSGVYSGIDAGVMDYHPASLKFGKDTAVWIGSAALSALMAVYSAFIKPFNFIGSIFDLAQDRKNFESILGVYYDR